METPCPECVKLRQRIAELEAKVERLTRLLEQSQRAGKRQAAPFSKGPPKLDPKLFPRQVISLFQESLALRDQWAAAPPQDQPDEADRARAFESFTDRLYHLTARPRADAANETLAKHLHHHGGSWFVFLLDPQVPATNWMGEQAIRPAVVNRKVWGGNRTDSGAEAQSITMSVLETCKRQTLDALTYVSQTLRGLRSTLFQPLNAE